MAEWPVRVASASAWLRRSPVGASARLPRVLDSHASGIVACHGCGLLHIARKADVGPDSGGVG
jgi:hypothetical protein